MAIFDDLPPPNELVLILDWKFDRKPKRQKGESDAKS